jgi:hypothetical protein
MNILFSPAHRLLLMMLRLTMTLTEAALNLKSTCHKESRQYLR